MGGSQGRPDDQAANSRTLLPALAAHPGHLFWRAAAWVGAAVDASLPPGVDVHAYAALLALSGGAGRSQQELAETISVSRTTMVRVAADLTAQGLVTRTRNPRDRRSYVLVRTPAGAATARAWRRHVEDLEDEVTRSFTLDQREDFRDLLRRIQEGELDPETPEPLLESIAFLVTRAHLRMHREFATALEPIRMEPRFMGFLTALESLGAVSQATLAQALGVSGATVVQVADDLERLGAVERVRSETDRRTQLLHLLPPSADLMRRARTASADVLTSRLARLDAAERERLSEHLVRLVTSP